MDKVQDVGTNLVHSRKVIQIQISELANNQILYQGTE
jgi:hypothetical protein